MTVQELRESLETLPQTARVEVHIGLNVSGEIQRIYYAYGEVIIQLMEDIEDATRD